MIDNKREVIRLLETIAIYMELKGENPFKIQAFRRAATTLEQDERTLSEIDQFTALPGIGKGTAAVIKEFLETGQSDMLKQLQAEVPKGLIPLLQIPGLGGKTIAKLYNLLAVENIDDLKRVCREGKVRALKGFGVKTEEKILKSIEQMEGLPRRFPLASVLPIVVWIEEQLSEMDAVKNYSRAGSVRRVKETVKDLDFIIATTEPERMKEQLLNMANIKEVTNQGDTKISCVFSFDFDISADFRLVKPDEFATTLHHFTGSKEHNIRMRQIAKERGEKISEYGVEQIETGKVLTFETETDFYHHFNLPIISPELRDDGTEIDQIDLLDELVKLADIRGDLHMHTTWSDGAHSIEEMIDACRKRGYEYMAITDHSQSLKVANGLSPDQLRKQMDIIRQLNEKYSDIMILAGIEMDILPDATFDYEDELLAEADLVIASIHSAFGQSEELIMKRLTAACKSPHIDIIAHPTGRKIGIREGYPVNIDRLIELAKATNTILELNASPRRLDLRKDHLIKAQQTGVSLIINTDSHHRDTLANMEIGVQYARSAWIKKDMIVNTKTAGDLLSFLKKTRASEPLGESRAARALMR